MSQVDSSGHMKVAIGGDVVRRRAVLHIIGWLGNGAPISHATPELRDGEILCERLGMMPEIVSAAP